MATERASELASYARVLELVVTKTARNLEDLAGTPASWGFDVGGDYAARDEGFDHINNWTSSFFTGMGLLAHKLTHGDSWIVQLERLAEPYRNKVTEHAMDTMHDLGFLYSLYSVGMYRTTGKRAHHKTALIAAEVLAKRFVAEGNYLRAWGRMEDQTTDYRGLGIIDSLMNLPLLYWAAKHTGEDRFEKIAVAHTETTLAHFIRPDGSVFHAYRFDPATGDPVGGDNYCGRSVNSHWARGSAWAMYGLALGYRHTGRKDFLEAALAVTRGFVEQLDESFVPVWDFRLVDGEDELRDSSAAAIAACAIQELERHGESPASVSMAKQKMLEALCSPVFLDASPDCRGLLKQGQVGDGLGKARNVYASWGDYFFAQAVAYESGIEFDCW